MKIKTPSAALEEIIRSLMTNDKDKVFEREKLLADAILITQRDDINNNVISGVINRLKNQGFLIMVGRGKYCYNKELDNKQEERYSLLKSKEIMDKIISDFEFELSKIDATKIETVEDLETIKHIKGAFNYLKEKREQIK